MDKFIEDLYSKYLQSSGVSIDTRTVEQGKIFIALKGPNFNGNQYAAQALEKGAALAVVDEEAFAADSRVLPAPASGLEVMQQLAFFHRQQLKCQILGITGSNGKTTTKELIARVLGGKYKVHATHGNLNNHLGVPLTLLQMGSEVEIGIVEMGANHVGEIAELCQIAQPHFGLITNIGEAHTETFGGIDGVLRGKSELFDFLRKNGGTPFINTADDRLKNMAKRFATPDLFPDGDVKFLGVNPFIRFELEEKEVATRLIGSYNFSNIAAAVAVGRKFGVSNDAIAQAIAGYVPANQRSQVIERGTFKIIMDAYNANPTSMKAALDNLNQMKGAKSVILADMKEVEDSDVKHSELGKFLSSLDLKNVFLMGREMKYTSQNCPGSLWFESLDLLKAHLGQTTFSNETLLIKGSRSMRLETILDLIN